MSSNIISKCFENKPIRWGLRGDPYLWDEMKKKTELITLPVTVNELNKLLHGLFKELTGENPQKGKNIFVKRFDNGGMSGGVVNSDFWIDNGFPLILKRYEESLM